MTELVTLTIDGVSVSVPPDTTLLKAAQSIGVRIPTICYHEACTANALCRICVVEVEGARMLIPACTAKAAPGMQVHTHTPRVERSRRTILELLASAVDLSEAPDILALIEEYGADAHRFPNSVRRQPPPIDDNPMYLRDYAKCILCWRCVQVCAEDAQYTFAINFSGRGYETHIGTFYNKPMPETTCVFCGQCVGVCPTNALKPRRQWLLEQGQPAEAVIQASGGWRRRRS